MKPNKNADLLKKIFFISTTTLVGVGVLASNNAWSQSAWDESSFHSANDMGGVGLIHTRSARFFDDGHFEAGASYSNPHRKFYFTWQILPRIEVTFRYTDITNFPFGVARSKPVFQTEKKFWSDILGFNDGRTFLDRTFDIKFLLAKEGDFTPQLAVGLQDFMGTGVFASEYLVASKRFGRFDVSMGIGWGEFAERSSFGNPIKVFGNNFEERENFSGLGGQFSFGQFFSGKDVGVFGGVEYSTQFEGLSLKVEYSSDNPDKSPFRKGVSVQPGRFPINFGAVYQPTPWFSVNVGLLRGQTPVVGFSLKANFNEMGLPKKDPPAPVVVPRSSSRRDVVFADMTLKGNSLKNNWVNEIQGAIQHQKVRVSYVVFEGETAFIQVKAAEENKDVLNELEFISKIFSTLPKSIKFLALTYSEKKITKVSYHYRISQKLYEAFQEVEANIVFSKDVLQISDTTIVSINSVEGNGELSNNYINGLISLFGSSGRLIINAPQGIEEFSPLVRESQIQAEEFLLTLSAAGINPKSISYKNQKIELEAPILQPNQITSKEAVAKLAFDWGASSVKFRDFNYKIDKMGAIKLSEEEEKALHKKIVSEVSRQGIFVYSVDFIGSEAILYSGGSSWTSVPKFIGRATRGMAKVLPPEFEVLTVVELSGTLELNRTSLMRSDIEKISTGNISPAELMNSATLSKPRMGFKEAQNGVIAENMYPGFSWYLVPNLQQNIGDPNEGIYNADVDLTLGGAFAILPGLSISVVGRQKLFGDLDQIQRTSNSVLPHVRSDVVSYLKGGSTTLDKLQLNYLKALAPEWHFMASAGILEQMYGGAGTEVLYRPFDKNWALGFDVAWVKQRGFNQLFGFRDYQTVTGFVSLYYELPFWDMRAVVKAGRYLAKDRGVTIDISRQFKSGVRVGAFSTFTNVSAADFGEGSFDKGFYIRFPMELFLQHSTRESASFVFKPITRDGGQMVAFGGGLYDFVAGRGYREIKKTWGTIFK